MSEYTGPKVGVGAVIKNMSQQTLIMFRGEGARNEKFKWDLPGGAADFGELLEDTVRREVKEELQLTLSLVQFNGYIEHSAEDGEWLSMTFTCYLEDQGAIPAVPYDESHKIESLRWATFGEITKYINEGTATRSLAANMEKGFI